MNDAGLHEVRDPSFEIREVPYIDVIAASFAKDNDDVSSVAPCLSNSLTGVRCVDLRRLGPTLVSRRTEVSDSTKRRSEYQRHGDKLGDQLGEPSHPPGHWMVDKVIYNTCGGAGWTHPPFPEVLHPPHVPCVRSDEPGLWNWKFHGELPSYSDSRTRGGPETRTLPEPQGTKKDPRNDQS